MGLANEIGLAKEMGLANEIGLAYMEPGLLGPAKNR